MFQLIRFIIDILSYFSLILSDKYDTSSVFLLSKRHLSIVVSTPWITRLLPNVVFELFTTTSPPPPMNLPPTSDLTPPPASFSQVLPSLITALIALVVPHLNEARILIVTFDFSLSRIMFCVYLFWSLISCELSLSNLRFEKKEKKWIGGEDSYIVLGVLIAD